MARKVKLILNPMADMNNAWKVAYKLRPIVADYGHADWSGTVYPTHAGELARQAGLDGYDMVVAVGGDGTVHEVINGLMQLPEEKRPILGVVPVGSGNDFAHAIGMPQKADRALIEVLHGEPSLVDIGLMTDEHGRKEYFNNTAGLGFDAVVTIRSHKLPLLRGFTMYLVAVLQAIILNHNPMKVRIKTESEEWDEHTLMVALCNGYREGGGFLMAPHAKIDDGHFDFVLLKNCGRLRMLRLLPEVMRGKHLKFKHVKHGPVTRFNMVSDRPLYIHLDGEVFTNLKSNLHEVTFEILPSALKVVRGSINYQK
jgi:YegS/Rv2252/BmrU family lipid kinase